MQALQDEGVKPNQARKAAAAAAAAATAAAVGGKYCHLHVWFRNFASLAKNSRHFPILRSIF